LLASLAAAVVLLVLVGCGSAPETVPIPQESIAVALRSELERARLHATWSTASHRSDFFDSDVRMATLRIDGADGPSINVYRFPTVDDACAGAARVGHRGSQVPVGRGVAFVSWIGQPHFFRHGRLIALYCEDGDARLDRRERTILMTLREVMGREFTGSSR
jgi:hypothetical protein